MLSKENLKYLRGVASTMQPAEHIGKSGITKMVIEQIDRNLEANELCKIKILPNSYLDEKETLLSLASSLNAEPIQNIGNVIVLYRFSTRKKNHVLIKNIGEQNGRK